MAAITIGVCLRCRGSLLEQQEGNEAVVTPCCHVFHKKCLKDWYYGYNLDFVKIIGENNCPKCAKPFKWSPISNLLAESPVPLFLDKTDNSDYSKRESSYKELEIEKVMLAIDKKKLTEEKNALENEREGLQEQIKKLENQNRQLAQDNAMKVEEIEQISNEKANLLEKNKELMKENTNWAGEEQKMLKEECQRLASEVDNLKYVQAENSELRKRMMTAEVRVVLLTNGDLLEEKFGELKWNEVTPTFQKELLAKLQSSGRPFMNFDEILPINSKALMRLIKASEKDETLLQRVIEDYYEGKKQPNGKISWSDLDNSLRVYLTSKLRETSQVDSLELEQVPLSSNTLVHLIKDKGDNNPRFLGKIVTGYVDEMVNESLALVNDLFKVALLEYINREVIGCLEIHFLNPQALETLVEVGMLRKKETQLEAYEFSHDSVRHCIIGMIMSRLIEQVKVARMDVFKLFHGGYTSSDPLGLYFSDYMSEVEQGYLANFAFMEISDNTLANLFMTLSVMRLPSLQPVIAVLKHCNVDVLDIVLSRKLPEDMTLTLLHAAAIRGDLERVRCLLYEFGFSKELSDPRFRNLILACVENTKECRDEKIQQRKEIVNEILKLNRDLVNCDVPSASLNVHDGLIKFMAELGADSWFPPVTEDDE